MLKASRFGEGESGSSDFSSITGDLSSPVPLCRPRSPHWLLHTFPLAPGEVHPMRSLPDIPQTGTLPVWPASGPKETFGSAGCARAVTLPHAYRAAARRGHVQPRPTWPQSLQEVCAAPWRVSLKPHSCTLGLRGSNPARTQRVEAVGEVRSTARSQLSPKDSSPDFHLSASSIFNAAFQFSNPFIPSSEGLKGCETSSAT